MKTNPTLRPRFIWFFVIGLAVAIIFLWIYSTQPMTVQTLSSDFWAGVDGVKQLMQ